MKGSETNDKKSIKNSNNNVNNSSINRSLREIYYQEIENKEGIEIYNYLINCSEQEFEKVMNFTQYWDDEEWKQDGATQLVAYRALALCASSKKEYIKEREGKKGQTDNKDLELILEKTKKDAEADANAMSAEELEEEIEELNYDIIDKRNNGEYENEQEEEIDKARLSIYKKVYKKKTGTNYGSNSGSSSNGGGTSSGGNSGSSSNGGGTSSGGNSGSSSNGGGTSSGGNSGSSSNSGGTSSGNNKPITSDTASIPDPIEDPSTYDPSKKNIETSKLTEIMKTLTTTLTTIGIGASVISLLAIGVKFMIGSLEERAKYKETMIPYLIGIILVCTISTIIRILSLFFFNIGN